MFRNWACAAAAFLVSWFAAGPVCRANTIAIGSASNTCMYAQAVPPGTSPLITQTSDAASFDFVCPDGYVGSSGSGAVDGSSTSAYIGNGTATPFGISYSLYGSSVATYLASGGNGSAMVEFTVTYDWLAYGDIASAALNADFAVNDSVLWSRADYSLPPSYSAQQPQQLTVVFDVPVTYGEAFSFSSSLANSGSGSQTLDAWNRIVVAMNLLSGGELSELSGNAAGAVPEPDTLLLVTGILAVLILQRRRGPVRPSKQL